MALKFVIKDVNLYQGLIDSLIVEHSNVYVDGERIEYNTITKQLKASNENSQGGRVQSTFIPSELQDKNKDNKQNNK